MSEARPSRLPLVALGCAVAAVGIATVAAVGVFRRDRGPSRAPVAAPLLIERRGVAADVNTLLDDVEIVVEAGQPRGVRPRDTTLARTLGIEDEDVIVALAGKPTTRERDVIDALLAASSMHVTSLYLEIEDRQRAHHVLRLRLEGDLFDARRDGVRAP